MSYCDIAPGHPEHGPYHDREYGFPLAGDDALFERLILEINQAGLSWLTILKKREAFRDAFRGFEIERVARFNERDRARLMNDERIIRNRLKVDAAIENAKRLRALGSFSKWLDAHHPRTKDEWVKLFKKTFVFTGGEITSSFLMSAGYLPGAHEEWCPVYAKILKKKPRWSAAAMPPL
ncbi:MAG TPA: DNA-3-methyladenine glycosylase I [Thermoanaerobaculia bacterium]|nr:DNA-3-methyladenine glycosylase I [Thermoanaerobaculia bacterium]